jgi:hypothetical protein
MIPQLFSENDIRPVTYTVTSFSLWYDPSFSAGDANSNFSVEYDITRISKLFTFLSVDMEILTP